MKQNPNRKSPSGTQRRELKGEIHFWTKLRKLNGSKRRILTMKAARSTQMIKIFAMNLVSILCLQPNGKTFNFFLTSLEVKNWPKG
jgi:hypothetical protein